MKGIKALNIATFIIIALVIILMYYIDNENILYILPIIYLILYISKMIIINRVLNNNLTVIKVKSKTIYDYVEFILSILFGILLIYNFWGQLAFRHDAANLLFALIGLVLMIESTQVFFYKRLFMTKDLISLNNGKGLSAWSKINKFEIDGKKLIIKTLSRNFWFRFDDIDPNDTEKILSIFNKKLSSLFNGTIVYDNEIRIVENNA